MFNVMHLDGYQERPEGADPFADLLDELEGATPEHGDVAVIHESGWSLTVLATDTVIWENVEDPGISPRYAVGLPRATILELMEVLSTGEFHTINLREWRTADGE